MRTDSEVEKLVADNLKLAHHFAQQWSLTYGEHDALSDAMEGLLRAARDWDETIPFGSYASLRIKWLMPKRHLMMGRVRRGGGLVHISIDQPVSEESKASYAEVIADPNGRLAVDNLCEDESLQAALALVGRLPERQRVVLERRFGLSGDAPETLEQIAQSLCLTKERVRQIQKLAVNRLQKWMRCPQIKNQRLGGLQEKNSKERHRRRIARRTACNKYPAVRSKRSMTAECMGFKFNRVYPRNGKLEKAVYHLTLNKTQKEVCRVTGLNPNTVSKIHCQMVQQGFLGKCQCGGAAGHRGWCKFRFAKSPKRQAVMKSLHQRQNEIYDNRTK